MLYQKKSLPLHLFRRTYNISQQFKTLQGIGQLRFKIMMTKKEINDYYEALENNAINNYGGYTKEQIDNFYSHLDDEDDDNFEEEYAETWREIINIEFDYQNPYDSYPVKVTVRYNY